MLRKISFGVVGLFFGLMLATAFGQSGPSQFYTQILGVGLSTGTPFPTSPGQAQVGMLGVGTPAPSATGQIAAAGNITTTGGQFNGSGAGLTNIPSSALPSPAGQALAPVYTTSGTLVTTSTLHVVYGVVSATSAGTVVTLTGAAVYTSSSSYSVVVAPFNSNTCSYSQGSGSQFTLYSGQAGGIACHYLTIGT